MLKGRQRSGLDHHSHSHFKECAETSAKIATRTFNTDKEPCCKAVFRQSDELSSFTKCDWNKLPKKLFKYKICPLLTVQDIAVVQYVSRSWHQIINELSPVRRAWYFDELMQVCDEPALTFFVNFRLALYERTILQPLFVKYCSYGAIRSVQLLARAANFSTQEIRFEDNCSLRWAAEAGHLNVVKWLCESFDITVSDVTSHQCFALATSISNGYLDVADFLVKRFNIGPNYAGPWLEQTMFESYRNGLMSSITFLREYFGKDTDLDGPSAPLGSSSCDNTPEVTPTSSRNVTPLSSPPPFRATFRDRHHVSAMETQVAFSSRIAGSQRNYSVRSPHYDSVEDELTSSDEEYDGSDRDNTQFLLPREPERVAVDNLRWAADDDLDSGSSVNDEDEHSQSYC